jgi:hypothetical protein
MPYDLVRSKIMRFIANVGKIGSTCSGVRASIDTIVMAVAATTVSNSRRWIRLLALSGFTTSPTFVARGIKSSTNSICFPVSPSTSVGDSWTKDSALGPPSILAQPLWHPITSWNRGVPCGVMEYENQGAALLRSCGGKVHWRPTGDDYRRSPGASDKFSIWGFQTGFSSECVPSLWSRMLMRGCCHARIEGRLHILGGVFSACGDG